MRKNRNFLMLFVACLALFFLFGCCAIPTPVVETIPVVEKVSFENIFFDLNKAVINDSSKALLKEYAPLLKAMAGKKILLEGYCDERGGAKYNLALGQKRANAVAIYLVELGVPQDMIGTVSYGFAKPIDPASNESAWAKNRRVQLTIN